jgi:hypothetical protein
MDMPTAPLRLQELLAMLTVMPRHSQVESLQSRSHSLPFPLYQVLNQKSFKLDRPQSPARLILKAL